MSKRRLGLRMPAASATRGKATHQQGEKEVGRVAEGWEGVGAVVEVGMAMKVGVEAGMLGAKGGTGKQSRGGGRRKHRRCCRGAVGRSGERGALGGI